MILPELQTSPPAPAPPKAMLHRGYDVLRELDAADVGRMVDKQDRTGDAARAAYEICDRGAWVADVSASAADLLIRHGLIEDLTDETMHEPVYAITLKGQVYLRLTQAHLYHRQQQGAA